MFVFLLRLGKGFVSMLEAKRKQFILWAGFIFKHDHLTRHQCVITLSSLGANKLKNF